MRKLLVYDQEKEKKVLCGYVDGDTFIRHVNAYSHFMQITEGYGIPEIAFDKFKKIKNVRIEEKDTGLVWDSKLSDWFDKGKVADYGHGRQRFLAIKNMLLKRGGDKL